MSRRTLNRVWTEQERELATRIVAAIAAADGRVVGVLQVIRGVGLPYGPNHRDQSRRQVYDVMPLAAKIAPQLYPGNVLVVQSDHTYLLTERTTPTGLLAPVRRMKRSYTSLDRAHDELLTDTLQSKMIKKMLGFALQALDPELLDSLVVQAEDDAEAEESA